MNNNYLVSFGLSVLSGFIHLNTNEIAQDRPIIAFLVGFVSLLFLTSIFTGISMLFKKDKSKWSETFMYTSIIFFMIMIYMQFK
jgi:hypothetical protein